MPTLAQMVATVGKATGYLRGPDEILDALDYGQQQVYFAVTHEYRMSFLKFDATSIAIAANQDTYPLPADFSELKQLAERQSATLPWRPMMPADLNDRDYIRRQLTAYTPAGDWGPISEYEYAGPYLDGEAAEEGTATWNVKLAPMPLQALACQIVYVAKYVPIQNAGSFLMMPDEGRRAMEALAIAELYRRLNDSASETYDQRAQRDLDLFLTWMRDRQIQLGPTVEPYLADLD